MSLFFIKKLVTLLVLPPASLLLLGALGLWLLRRRRRAGQVLVALSLLLLLLCSTPPLPLLLERALAVSGPLDLSEARRAQAIVLLGGGIVRNAPEFGGESLSRYSLERTRYAARVERLTGLPILVSGGTVFAGSPEAELMSTVLEQEFRVPVRWMEARSRTTHENAVESGRILAMNGIHRIVLVTHGVDMRRAKAEFEAAGLEVVPAPTVLPGSPGNVLDWIPSAQTLERSRHALYELLALAVVPFAR